jgi:opacity protein-like surface antigen
MKKIVALFTVAVALIAAGSAKAQISLHVGYMPETITDDITNVGSNDVSLNGFFVGGTYNANIAGDLNLALGLQARYNMKSETETLLGIETKTNLSQLTLDVPILFNYGIDLGSSLKLSAFVGPSVSFALLGQSKISIAGNENTTNWYENNEDLSRLNLYGTVGIALTLNGQYRFFLGYNMGLLDLDKSDNCERKTNGLFLGLGMGI